MGQEMNNSTLIRKYITLLEDFIPIKTPAPEQMAAPKQTPTASPTINHKAKKTSATVWAILYTPNKVILGKRAPSTNNPNQWNFFGGHIDVGESAIDALQRELQEETGFTGNLDFKMIAQIGNATYFTAKVSGSLPLNTTSEISKIKSFKLTDLPDNLHSKTQNFFSRLDILLS